MASSTRSRASTASAGSLLQDLPGAFPKSSTDSGRPPPSDATTDVAAPQSLYQTVHARRAEFVRPKHIRLKIGTWNVSASKGAEKDIGAWFVDGKGVTEALAGLKVGDNARDRHEDLGQREDVASQEARYARKQATAPSGDPGSVPGGKEIGLYVLGLQEVVDVNSVSEALRPYSDPGVANKWKRSVEAALPLGYQFVAEQQLIGMLLLIYASGEVAQDVKCVSTTSVGTGIAGYMGNKGAVTARIVLGETTRLVFIDCHLSAGSDPASLDRRNWDAAQVVTRTRFEPIHDESMGIQQGTGEMIGDEDLAFWIGDLNYRLEGIPGDDVRRLLMLHTRNEYDNSRQTADRIDLELANPTSDVKRRVEERRTVGSAGLNTSTSTTDDTYPDQVAPSDDPTSLQTTLSSLLPHDELHQQMSLRKAFHDGWREGPITFLPTYKYDIGSVGVFDSSEKKRAPSWCDRILYRTRRDRLAYTAKVQEEINAKKKDEEMSASGVAEAVGEDEGMLYDYDPETDGVAEDGDDGDNDVDDKVVVTKEGFEDLLELEYYVAHQRILSSDHKPLDAVFGLTYAAVDQKLKAQVHAEVVRELDKAENETRPDVTVVIDPHYAGEAEQTDADPLHFEGVWFGDVRWGQGKHRTLTIANTGRVAAAFTFIERPVSGPHQTTGVAPKWLNLSLNDAHISSSSTNSVKYWLEPGESATIELEVRIFDLGTVHDLNEGLTELDDILVLRVEGGRDHFVPIAGLWKDTSLGRSINKLVRIPEGGIRRLQRQVPGQGKARPVSTGSGRGSQEDTELPVCVSAPRELFRLTEAAEEVAAKVVHNWATEHDDAAYDGAVEHDRSPPWKDQPGWPFSEACWPERETETWRESLSLLCNAVDTDQELVGSLPAALPLLQRLGVLAQYLMLFLRSIPEGVVTESVWGKIDGYLIENERAKRTVPVEEEKMAVQEMLHDAPAGHAVSFVLITAMIERMVQHMTSAPPRPPTLSQSDDIPIPVSPKRPAAATLRRMTGLGRLPAAAPPPTDLAHSRGHALAKLFGEAMVRLPASEKHRAAMVKRRDKLIALFLVREVET